MKLYLVRHAEAIERSSTTPDASRYLTTKGRLSFRKIARRARKAGAAPGVIFTSPLLRSVQTAEILAERLKHRGAVVVSNELSPGFDLRALRALLADAGNPAEAAFVGHEPDLGYIAAALISVPGGFSAPEGSHRSRGRDRKRAERNGDVPLDGGRQGDGDPTFPRSPQVTGNRPISFRPSTPCAPRRVPSSSRRRPAGRRASASRTPRRSPPRPRGG